MYQIVAEQTSAVNGLGAGGEVFANVMTALTPVINAGSQIAQTAINAKNNQNPNQYTGENTYTPTVYQPPTVQPATTTTGGGEKKTDWTPWLIGGAIVLGGMFLIMKK